MTIIVVQGSYRVGNLGKSGEFDLVLSRPGTIWRFVLKVITCLELEKNGNMSRIDNKSFGDNHTITQACW